MFVKVQRPPPRVCIIGGGIGGATTAYFLRQLFGNQVMIDIYEKQMVGGRLALLRIGDHYYESGAATIRDRNVYLNSLLKKLNLQHARAPERKLGVFNGHKFVFKEKNTSTATYMYMMRRYGFRNMLRWNKLTESMLEKFDNIYEFQKKGHAFFDVESLLSSMSPDFVKMSQMTLKDLLLKKKFSQHFIEDIAKAVTRANYGQSYNINGIVGAMSLLTAQANMWSVRGGNNLLVKEILKSCKLEVIPATIGRVTLQKDGKYSLNFKRTKLLTRSESIKLPFDIVIVAAPQTKDQGVIAFRGFPMKIGPFAGSFHRTVVTLVQGTINANKFGFVKPNSVIETIVTNNERLPYSKISYNYPVKFTGKETFPTVWKVCSDRDLTPTELNDLFPERSVVKSVDWLAYPRYSTAEKKLCPFKLFTNLYYTSAIEWVGSAVEMSVIAGRNVALLAYNEWLNKNDKINTAKLSPEEYHPLPAKIAKI